MLVDNHIGICLIVSSIIQPFFFMWYKDFNEIKELIFISTGKHMRKEIVLLIKYISTFLLITLLLTSIPQIVNLNNIDL